ncbi:MAG: ABC transporter ATP-binding protein [Methanobrevibacter sp.]|jgi:ABC-2 type transport system ATP-binding protein|nr:ABC transporter ATP-binding protein [Candidatus Methanovirga procula]
MGEIKIRLSNLNKYYNDFHVLDNLSLTVEKGKIFAYLGPNGAGKTSTIKLLIGLSKPSSGEVKILDKNPYGKKEAIIVKEKIGMMLDSATMYLDLTGLENLIYWGELYGLSNKKSEKIANELMDTLKLSDWKNSKVSHYSHGMKKRLAFARAIIHNPEIIILDEPTNGVDFESRELIRELIKKLAKEGRTVFFSSHDLEEVQKICTSLAIINKGKLLFNGSLQDLQDKCLEKEISVVLKDEIALKKFLKTIEEKTIIKIDGNMVSFIPTKDIDLNQEDIVSHWIKESSIESLYKNIISSNEKNE